jgi:hypothetical protein
LFKSGLFQAVSSSVAPETRPSARNPLPSPEDKIHRYLLLALGVLAGVALFIRGQTSSSPERTRAGASASSAPVEVSRPALDAAIAQLARWIERAPSDPRTPLEANLRLLALGRPALGLADGAPRAALAWANLEVLSGSRTPPAQLAGLPESTPADARDGVDARDGAPPATLAILLETGMALDETLPLASGPIPIRRLLELALARAAEPGGRRDPWLLDLLSFAVLGGVPGRRPELVRSTVAGLLQLERAERPLSRSQGDGPPAAELLDRLAAELGQRRAGAERGGRELQLSAAVFRAVAVLAEPDLEQRALRHLNALLYRYQLERDVYAQLLARAPDDAARAALHLDALEALGRLEQALYGAHLTFRHGDRTGPGPRTALSMRRAAGDLIEHLTALTEGSAFEKGPDPRIEAPQALMRAATQALRGLRAARGAT